MLKKFFYLFNLILLFSVLNNNIYSQDFGRLRGVVTDSTNGEALAFCNVYIEELGSGASTNERGIYVINRIPASKEYTVIVSYIGYNTKKLKVEINSQKLTDLNVMLVPTSVQLQTIEKVGERVVEPNSTDLSLHRITVKELELTPKGVETDLFRTIQFLPGVRSTGDVSARYYVRGGTGDQNLVLLNGITLYNPFHALGLFSVVPPEMINSVEFFKGGFSSKYGGRLSSVMDIISKDGNKYSHSLNSSISLLTAKIMAEGPIPNGSYLITGRKTHSTDILGKFLNDQTVPIDFYDLSFKLNYTNSSFFNNAKFNIFGFISRDDLKYDNPNKEELFWKNTLLGFEWLQVYDVPIFSRLGVSISSFEGQIIPNNTSVKPRRNQIDDFTVSFDVNSVFEDKNEIEVGIEIKSLKTKLINENNVGVVSDLEKNSGKLSAFAKFKFLQFDNLGIDAGTRFNLGGFNLNSGFSLEPRLGFTYRPIEILALKGSWGLFIQEVATVTDEDEVVSLFEPWVILPDYLQPSTAIHYTGGAEINFSNSLKLGIEGYYKIIHNLPIINQNKFYTSDPDLISGNAESYGWEFLLNFIEDPYYFSASYTLSWAYKESEERIFYPKYDSRHVLNFTFDYNFGNGWSANTVWSYSSGLPFTQILGFYDKLYFTNPFNQFPGNIEISPYTILSDKNLGRLPVYHRLDLGVSKVFSLFFLNMEAGISVINIYDRKNIFYYDRATGERVNMLPRFFSGTLKVEI